MLICVITDEHSLQECGSKFWSVTWHRLVGRSPGECFWVMMAHLKNLPSTSKDLHFTFGVLRIRLFARASSTLPGEVRAANLSPVNTVLANPVKQRSSADSKFISAFE
jgi:hypothetical protein